MTDFKEELATAGVLVFTNVGVSMMPLLRQHRDVMVIRAQTEGFRKNDVVLFLRDNGQYVLHRIVKVYENAYFIIGDNCLTGERVRADQLLGRLTEIRRNDKTILMTDVAYRWYVFTVPMRRVWLWMRYYLFKMKRKLRRQSK